MILLNFLIRHILVIQRNFIIIFLCTHIRYFDQIHCRSVLISSVVFGIDKALEKHKLEVT
jgi:hypothetical protein